MTKKIKIGVLGCANIAKRSVIPSIQQIDTLQLQGIASRTFEKAQSFANIFSCKPFASYTELLESDVDAVYIPLPTGMHFEWVKLALENNKHVICEKSLACTLEEVSVLVNQAKENKLVLMENFMFEYHSQHKTIKSMIEADEIGEIRCFRSSFGFPPFPDANNIRYQKALGGGAVLDACGYPVKASQLYLSGKLTVNAATLIFDKEKDVDIWGGAYISSDKGIFSEIAFGFHHFYQCNIEIWGTKGKIIADRAFTAGPGFKPTIHIQKQDSLVSRQLPADNHFVNILKEFVRRIEENDFNDSNYNALITQSNLLEQIRNHDSNKK